MILNIFSPKNLAKILAFFAQTTASFCKNMIVTLLVEKNANFFAENWQKSQKIVIITSTPGRTTQNLRFVKISLSHHSNHFPWKPFESSVGNKDLHMRRNLVHR
jgi:hypothetical protein